MGTAGAVMARENFIWALASMCRSCRLAFDPELLGRRYPPPHSIDALVEAARALGMRAVRIRVSMVRLKQQSLPCLVFLRTFPGEADTRSTSPALAVLVGMSEEGAELVEPGADRARRVLLADLDSTLSGEGVGFGAIDPPTAAEPGERSRAFGFADFAGELLRQRALCVDVLAASLVLQLLGLMVPLLTQVVIDKVVVHQTVQTLWVVGGALVVSATFSALLAWLRQYLLVHAGNRVDAILSRRLFAHLLALPPRYFEDRPTGTLVARLQGVETIREFVSGAALLLLVDLPFAAVFVGVMLWYSPLLTAAALGFLLLIALLSLAVAPALRRRLDRQFLAGAKNQAFLTEHISGIDTVKSLQMEPVLQRRYETRLSDYLQTGFSARMLAAGYQAWAQVLEQALTIVVLCLGAWLVMQNDGFTVGMLVAFQMFTARAAQPLLRIANLWQEFQQAAVAVRRLGDLADAPTEPGSETATGVRAERPSVTFDDVWFRYDERGPWILRGLGLVVPHGSIVAITGPSGCGKSTIARLLQGFVSPRTGAVSLGGRAIQVTPVNELRAALGVVPQETALFSGTLLDNLLLAAPEATQDDLISAARFAEIHDFIASLPDGYASRIGEHGIGLSGGQRQRLAIARALLRRPSVLLLDEATSQLDSESASRIAATLSRLRGRVTVIFIGHHVPEALAPDFRVDLGALADTERGA